MDDLKSFHYKLSKIVLLTFGLWPYDKSWLTKVKRVLVLAIMVSTVALLLTAYYLHHAECDEILFINTLFYLLLNLIVMLKYTVFLYHSNDLKTLVEMLWDSWRSLSNEDEQQIILKYAEKGKFQYTVITLSICILLFTLGYIEITKSQNMDICESSMNFYLTIIYVTVDRRYIRLLLLQALCVLVGGASIISVTETTITMITYYITGLFKVIQYRMRNVFNEGVKTRTDETARERLIDVAKMHMRTIHICNKTNCFAFSYFILLVLGTCLLIIILLHLSRLQLNELRLLGVGIIVILMVCTYMFFCNHMVQNIMDSSSELLTEAYNTEWYNAPVSTQKMLLFVAQHCINTYTFNIGGLFVPSYEGFSSVIKQSFSYFMVIRSTQM